MSQSLYWLPKQPDRGKALGCGLKFALQSEYFDGASLATMTVLDIKFLRGIIAGASDAQVKKDAQHLIDAIDKHDTIEVWIG